MQQDLRAGAKCEGAKYPENWCLSHDFAIYQQKATSLPEYKSSEFVLKVMGRLILEKPETVERENDGGKNRMQKPREVWMKVPECC